MLKGKIKVGDSLIWEPREPQAYERIVVTQVVEHEGERWVETEGRNGQRYWNIESRVREACVRKP